VTSEWEAVLAIRRSARTGAYAEAQRYADALSVEMRSHPAIALERARTFLRQGHPIHAEAALAAAALDRATAGECLILAMERASVRVYRYVAIREALATARSALETAAIALIDPADRAEAERVHARILLSAATYREVPRQEWETARDRLPTLAQLLEHAGKIDEALAARIMYAERLEEPDLRDAALAHVADDATEANLPSLAGEAHVLRAEYLLASSAASDEVQSRLGRAETLYRETGHRHGLIDVQRVRAKLAIERELAAPMLLEACLEAYRQVEYHRGTLTVLMDLSQLAHERGDTRQAADYQQQLIDLSGAVGMGLSLDSFRTAQIDLLMRNHNFGAAIELCEAAIATELPAMSRALYEQLLGTAYSFIDDVQAACDHGRNALRMFEGMGDTDSASDAVLKLTSDLSSLRQDDAWDEAEGLLGAWFVRDEARKDINAAVNKQEMIAQIKLERFFFSQTHHGELPLLDDAEAAIASAESLTSRLSKRDAVRRLGNLQQLRGQVYQARGDEEGVIRSWRAAISIYERAAFAMEAANCQYMLGVKYLNRSNEDLLPSFGESEEHLRAAMGYYDSSGMRGQAADTRFMFARLYANASLRVPPDLKTQLLDAALAHLLTGETDYDAVRREFHAGRSVVEVQRGKRALIEKSRRLYDLSMEILCVLRPDPTEAWNRAQRAKARGLTDVLGMSSVPPARVIASIREHQESVGLVTEERELTKRMNQAPPEDRAALGAELQGLWARMAGDPRLREYLELRSGAAIDGADLVSMLTVGPATEHACVCVDWIAAGNRLFLLSVRPGHPPQLTPLTLPLSVVQAFVKDEFAPDVFRLTLRDTPEILRQLDPLVAPLRDLCAPEELLILSPTGPLHALPLHALEVDGDPLIVRNPVVYVPSLSVLRHCLSRRRERTPAPTVALFGDPSGDRPEAARLVAHLGERFGVTPFLQANVTRTAFCDAIAGRDLVHFQGHAKHDLREPLNSYLSLAEDEHLTARDIFGVADFRAELVTLAACESASSFIAAGDEPMGLIPAFLYAGAGSVLATLWKVEQTSAARTMQLFYDTVAETRTTDKARILRRAILAVRETPGFDTPYHWAPFVLHGDWQR
jgi:hypothetical protein